MPTTSGAPYTLYQNIDSIPASGSLSSSTPTWAMPMFYIKNSTTLTYANLELATGSAIVSMSSAQSESFEFNGVNYKWYKRKGSKVDPSPISPIAVGEYRYCSKGFASASEFSGSSARNANGTLKKASGAWICKDKNGAIVWSSVIHMDWDRYVDEKSVPIAEVRLNNPRNSKSWKDLKPATIGKVVNPPPPTE